MRNGIELSKVMDVVDHRPADVRLDEKRSWLKLSTKNGNVVYIARQKQVRQIDLSGFGRNMKGTIPLQAENGRVQAHLDLSDEASALTTLAAILIVMGSVHSDTARRPPAPRIPLAATTQRKRERSTPPMSADERHERLAHIRAAAEALGAQVELGTEGDQSSEGERPTAQQ